VADRVVFLRPDAERIARAVRTVEAGNRNETPLRFGRTVESGKQKVFRIGTFSGAWNIGASKTVTFKYQTTTPNTVSATNLFWPLPNNGTRDCSIAKDGTAWFLLVPQLGAGTALSSATLGGSLQFGRINVVSLGTASTVSIAVTTCTT
jgi:hypothetical protein